MKVTTREDSQSEHEALTQHAEAVLKVGLLFTVVTELPSVGKLNCADADATTVGFFYFPGGGVLFFLKSTPWGKSKYRGGVFLKPIYPGGKYPGGVGIVANLGMQQQQRTCFFLVLRDVPRKVQGTSYNRIQGTTKALPLLFALHDAKNRLRK